MFQEGELKSLGIATGLIILNIAVMWIFAFTPLATINNLLFNTFFLLGVIVYGLLLSGGLYIARKGIRSENTVLAVAGTGLIQVAYGIFGAGILGMVAPGVQAIAIAITGVISVIIALLAGLLVYGTGHDFSSWGRYANYIFLGVLGFSLIGSFSPTVIIVAFTLALIGFIVYLIHEIYMVKTQPGKPFLNGIGVYTAFMGVFVEILQLVVQMIAEE
ncbi:hypothetical protein ACK3SF_05030 [Candidatus Nanosalina sp. VS9-1]|uniref:hypothetical protein n=1 Tax=Candidatus Nanosalina sp. VS9-1 TaxID=3388566 RepID=UPI0039E0D1C4